MATVIDSLIVALSLDPKEFTKGQKAAAAEILKTRQAAEKHGKGIEKSMEGAAEAVDRLARNALKLFAIFTAGRAIGAFTADVTAADAALGRLAKSVGSTPDVISSLGNAVARNGGSATAAAGSFERLADSINEIKTTGNSSILPYLYRLQGLGGKQINLNKEMSETFGDLAENAKNIADKQGVPFATYLLKQAGVDRDTAALLVKGREAYNKALAESRRIGIVRKEDTEAAQKLETTMESLRQTSEGFGRTILTAVTPTITDLLERMREWITANQDWIKTEIVAKVREFAEWLKTIDWNSILSGIREFIKGADDAAKAVGGWKVVAEAFFALWAASRIAALFAPIMLQIAGIRLALLGLGPVGWSLLGLGAIGGALAAADPNKAIVSGGRDPVGALNPGDELPGAGPATPREGSGGTGRRGWWRRNAPTWLGGDRAGGAGIRDRAARGASGRIQQNANSAAALEEFKKAGLPAEGIAALMGSAQQESSFNPRASNGSHTGLLQWDNQTRWPKIEKWIKSQGGDPYDARWQAQAAIAEGRAKPGDPLYDHPRTERGWKALETSAGNLGKAIGGISDIERFGAGEEGRRASYAQSWLPHVNGSAPSPTAVSANTPAGVNDISKQATYSNGQLDGVKGFVVHHTGGRGTPESVVGTLNQRGLGVQYVMDRDGKVYQTLPPGARGAHIRPAQNGSGLSNANSLGMEVIAKDDKDITPTQVEAAKRFIGQMQKQYPGMQVYGHGEINGHKQETEGKTIVDAIRKSSPPAAVAPAQTSGLDARRAGAMAAIAQVSAAQVASVSNTSNDNRNSYSSENHIGSINIQTASTDASGIARDIKPALQRHAFAAAANYARA